MRAYTKITLENENGEYSVAVNNVQMNIDGLIDDIIRPMLLAAGYHPGGVAKLYSLVEPEGGVDDTEMDADT